MTAPTARAPRQPVFRVTLPLPPSVNVWLAPVIRPLPDTPGTRSLIRKQMAVRGADGRIWGASLAKSTEAKKWIAGARAALAAMPRPLSLHTGVLEMTVVVYVPTISSDGNNRLKLPEDAFNGLVWADDRQVVVWHIRKDIGGKDRARVEIEVRKADPAAHPHVSARLAQAERVAARKEVKAHTDAQQLKLGSASWKSALPATSSPGAESYGRRHNLVPESRPKRPTPEQLKAMATSAYRPPRSRR